MSGYAHFEIHAVACNDVGRVRRTNEDSFCVANLTERTGIDDNGVIRFASGPQGALFAVADGMGGAASGETASQVCLKTLHGEVLSHIRGLRNPGPDDLEQILIDAVGAANQKVFELSHTYEEFAGMGTTLTTVLEAGGRMVIGQIGDSRAYLVRDNNISQITRDQSLVAQMVSTGELTEEEARHHPERNILLQALGVRSTVSLALKHYPVRDGDMLLLSTDGLHSQMTADEIYQIVIGAPGTRDACLELVDLANKRGGPDNITALLIEFLPATLGF
jgi:serine/threonine protein phosphatase PrpC